MHYGIALGSNLGDRLGHLREAVLRMTRLPGTSLLSAAPVYESDPVDCPEGSLPFYNTVVEIGSPLAPLDLLRELQGMEAALGRPHSRTFHAPRTVDLDILYAIGEDGASHTLETSTLVLPHPRLVQRRFVLEPLTAIRPDLVLPGQDLSVSTLLEALQSPEPPLKLISVRL